jgi:hypothetical protein
MPGLIRLMDGCPNWGYKWSSLERNLGLSHATRSSLRSKGAQALRMRDKFSVHHLATGNMLRQQVTKKRLHSALQQKRLYMRVGLSLTIL